MPDNLIPRLSCLASSSGSWRAGSASFANMNARSGRDAPPAPRRSARQHFQQALRGVQPKRPSNHAHCSYGVLHPGASVGPKLTATKLEASEVRHEDD